MNTGYIDDLNIEDIPTQTTDSLLESLSLEIMESSIMDQITNGQNPSRDFLETIIDKFNAIVENADDDSVRGIKNEMIDWCNRLITAIVREYNLGYNNPGEETLDCIDILESLYHFFILDKKENTKTFFINYININKKQIVDTLGIGGRGSDVTSLAYRKKNIPKNNIPILSNLSEVIQFIMDSSDVTSDDFFELVNDGDYYTNNVQYYFESGMLAGVFFDEYVKSEIGSYADDISTELRAAIRAELTT